MQDWTDGWQSSERLNPSLQNCLLAAFTTAAEQPGLLRFAWVSKQTGCTFVMKIFCCYCPAAACLGSADNSSNSYAGCRTDIAPGTGNGGGCQDHCAGGQSVLLSLQTALQSYYSDHAGAALTCAATANREQVVVIGV